MQFSIVAATPPSLRVPDDLQHGLDVAVNAGTADAAAWAAHDPAGTPGQFDGDIAANLAGPPTGAGADADLVAVRAAQATRTPSDDLLAIEFAESSARPSWQAAIDEIGRTQGPEQARRAAALVAESRARNGVVTDEAKRSFDRRRPYEVDPSITTAVYRPHANASYPSGHASGAYASALVLAALLPERAAHLRAMADQVAYSRVYGGVHFPSDVAAGARIGAQVAADVLRRAASSERDAAAA